MLVSIQKVFFLQIRFIKNRTHQEKATYCESRKASLAMTSIQSLLTDNCYNKMGFPTKFTGFIKRSLVQKRIKRKLTMYEMGSTFSPSNIPECSRNPRKARAYIVKTFNKKDKKNISS